MLNFLAPYCYLKTIISDIVGAMLLFIVDQVLECLELWQ